MAFRCAMLAVEGGCLTAHALVGDFFERGIGVARSRADALRWYASGAALGDVNAAASLARLHAVEE